MGGEKKIARPRLPLYNCILSFLYCCGIVFYHISQSWNCIRGVFSGIKCLLSYIELYSLTKSMGVFLALKSFVLQCNVCENYAEYRVCLTSLIRSKSVFLNCAVFNCLAVCFIQYILKYVSD